MKQMVLKRKNDGITLIALVITIIVLIIFAGIIVTLTTEDNGILDKTIYARENQMKQSIR